LSFCLLPWLLDLDVVRGYFVEVADLDDRSAEPGHFGDEGWVANDYLRMCP